MIALEEDPGGDELELVTREGERELRVDGERAFGGNRQLEQVGERQGESYVVRAARLGSTASCGRSRSRPSSYPATACRRP